MANVQMTYELAVIQSYKNLQLQITDWLVKTPRFTHKFLADKLNLSRPTFYSRLKCNNWTPEELEIIINLYL